MPYGNKARDVRAYEFGCLAPIEGESAALDAVFGRVRLWNALVELSREHQVRVDELLAPFLAEATDDAARKTARKAAWKVESVKAAAAALEKELHQTARATCRESGLYWCNYEAVLVAWQNARRRPGDLRFHSARLEPGKVSVRWQTGLATAAAFGDDTRMRVEPVSDEAWSNPVRGERRRLSRTVLRLRVASQDRKPVWLVLPMVMHRPLPIGGLVRECSVLRERVGLAWRWKAVLIVETPAMPDPAAEEPGREVERRPTVSLDIGWRKRPDGLRVCAWRDDAGKEGELLLNPGWLSEMAKTEDLRSIRDQQLNGTRAALLAWLMETPSAPEWLRAEKVRFKNWRSASSMMRLVRLWRESRWPGDEVGLAMIEEWRKREVHLYDWEANLRDQLIRNRRELFRLFAADLMHRYGRIVLEDFDLRPVVMLSRHAKEMRAEARHQRVWAATSVLRQAIRNAAEREGVLLERVPCAYTTLICGECGALERFDKAAELVHTCEGCGAVWDQDANAAANLLDDGFSQKAARATGSGETAAGAC